MMTLLVLSIVTMLALGTQGCGNDATQQTPITAMHWSAVSIDVDGNPAAPTGYLVTCRSQDGTQLSTDVGLALEVSLQTIAPTDGDYWCMVSAYSADRSGNVSNAVHVNRTNGVYMN